MRIILCMVALMAMSFVELAAQAQKAPDKGIVGIWQGVLKVPGMDLRIVIKVMKQPDGSLKGTLDSPDQGATDLALDSVTFKDGAVVAELKMVGGKFEGKLSADGSELVGEWSQGGGSLPLTLKRTEKAPEAPRRPQEPKKPYPYDEAEVAYENKAGGVKLAGTLTLPRAKGPFPAVILITGSGAQNRDEELLGHKPFLVLADYLTRRGIAVLRVDDRGVGGSTGSVSESTSEDFAGDVLAGVAFLKTRKEINPKQIGLIGHSEGGIIGPMVAAKSKDIAFVVMMAGTGLTGEEILYLQGGLIAKASGAPDEAVARNHALQERIIAIVKAEKEDSVAATKLREAMTAEISKLSEAEKKALGGDPKAFIEGQVKAMTNPWMRYFLTYDPKTALRKVTCPVLAINGEKDLQVPPKQNLPAIEAALKEAGNKDFTIKELPGLNHLFQTAQTGSPEEYFKIEETIAPIALQTMGDWILKHTKG